MSRAPGRRAPRPLLLLPLLLLLFAAVDAARAPSASARAGHHRLGIGAAAQPGSSSGHIHDVQVDTVHVVFSNHLEMGFTDQDDVVIEQYFYEHWPRAIALADADPSFVFTTHAYLLSLFFDCPGAAAALALRCPSAEQRKAVAAAIQRGALTYHAAPFNPQYDMFDAPLLEYAVEGVARRLDRRFGLPEKRVASLRDVPGMTRAALPALARAGVRAVSAGVNGFSAPPGFPKNAPFLWRDAASGAELLYFVHPGGYGGVRRDDGCVAHPRSRHAVCAWWNAFDNGGPPNNASEVRDVLAAVRREFPEAASVVPSTLEAYVDALWREAGGWDGGGGGGGGGGGDDREEEEEEGPPRLFSWPGRRFFEVVTGEVGDTWIHGVGADVTRVADYRAALRARRAYCGGEQPPPRGCSGGDDSPSSAVDGDDDGSAASSARAVDEFSRMILKVPEHTWGVAFGAYFGDFTNYTNAYLHEGIGWRPSGGDDGKQGGGGGAAEAEAGEASPPRSFKPDSELAPNYAAVVRSWRRQYGYLDAARRALMLPPPAAAAAANPPAKTKHPLLEAWDADVAEREALAGDEAFARVAAAAIEQAEGEESGGGGAVADSTEEEEEADGRWRPIFVRRGGSKSSNNSGSNSIGDDDDCSPFSIRLVHWSLAFDRCTGGLTSLRRRRWDAQGGELPPGADWAGGGGGGGRGDRKNGERGVAAELRYDVYSEEDYAPVWRDYAYAQPPWVGDFGKLNLSAALDPIVGSQRRVGATPRLAASFARRDPPSKGGGYRLRLAMRFDEELVREAGAPREAWLDVREPPKGGRGSGGGGEAALIVAAVWRRKTPTRRPEALWLRFSPGAGASVDASSWRLDKVGGGASRAPAAAAFSVSPFDVVVNGSHAMHAVSDAGVAVWSAAVAPNEGAPALQQPRERLRIGTLDAALVAAGAPLPLPVPRRAEPPDLEGEGVSFNLVNNCWGTNYPMWSPWRAREVNAAFRFVLTATTAQEEEEEEEEKGRRVSITAQI